MTKDELQRKIEWLRKVAALGGEHDILACDVCGAIYPEDAASNSESCDSNGCGRFKQRMPWASRESIARHALKLLEAQQELR